jgi:hypothetical protein
MEPLTQPSMLWTPAAAPTALTTRSFAPQRRLRTWPGVLTLFLLAPMVAEMLTGSTPPLNFINPVSLLLEIPLYGAGAVLARELARRRGLGWGRLLLLGAAYGVLEEGLTIGSWFNPYWPDVAPLGTYSRLFETNWLWAVGLTTFHAIFSVTIPVILVETIYPRIADRPWLGGRGYAWVIVCLVLASLVTLGLLGVLLPASIPHTTYTHPPLMWFGALAVAVTFVWLGLRRPRASDAPPGVSPKRAPRFWTLRILAFFCPPLYFILGSKLLPIAAAEVALFLVVCALVIWRVVTWSRRAGWEARHRLALAAGAMAFFIFVGAPALQAKGAQEDKNYGGMVLAAVFWLALLIWLAWRARRTERRRLAIDETLAPVDAQGTTPATSAGLAALLHHTDPAIHRDGLAGDEARLW